MLHRPSPIRIKIDLMEQFLIVKVERRSVATSRPFQLKSVELISIANG